VRKISKYLPKSNELLARALDLDDRADRGVDQNFETPSDITLVDEDLDTKKLPSSPMDALKQKMGVKPPAADIVTTAEPDTRQEDAQTEAQRRDERLRLENEALDRELFEEEKRQSER
jgi:hypothetical protein